MIRRDLIYTQDFESFDYHNDFDDTLNHLLAMQRKYGKASTTLRVKNEEKMKERARLIKQMEENNSYKKYKK